MKRTELTAYLDEFLNIRRITDTSLNGLQVEGPAEVRTVALAVDARLAAFEAAAKMGAEMLIVHHGLFWGKPLAITGTHYRRVRALMEGGVGLYACHLPLDAHPQVGNNAELARLLGLRNRGPAGDYHGETIGFGGRLPKGVPITALAQRLENATGQAPVRVVDAGRPARRVACVSGGAADMAAQFADLGFDTFVTGEVSHSCLPTIEELGINVIFGGHYATETLGVKALGRHLHRRFGLKIQFVDLPTDA